MPQTYGSRTLHQFVPSGAWQTHSSKKGAWVIQSCLQLHLAQNLDQYYRQARSDQHGLTAAQDFEPTMLGEADAPELRPKGAEAVGGCRVACGAGLPSAWPWPKVGR